MGKVAFAAQTEYIPRRSARTKCGRVGADQIVKYTYDDETGCRIVESVATLSTVHRDNQSGVVALPTVSRYPKSATAAKMPKRTAAPKTTAAKVSKKTANKNAKAEKVFAATAVKKNGDSNFVLPDVPVQTPFVARSQVTATTKKSRRDASPSEVPQTFLKPKKTAAEKKEITGNGNRDVSPVEEVRSSHRAEAALDRTVVKTVARRKRIAGDVTGRNAAKSQKEESPSREIENPKDRDASPNRPVTRTALRKKKAEVELEERIQETSSEASDQEETHPQKAKFVKKTARKKPAPQTTRGNRRHQMEEREYQEPSQQLETAEVPQERTDESSERSDQEESHPQEAKSVKKTAAKKPAPQTTKRKPGRPKKVAQESQPMRSDAVHKTTSRKQKAEREKHMEEASSEDSDQALYSLAPVVKESHSQKAKSVKKTARKKPAPETTRGKPKHQMEEREIQESSPNGAEAARESAPSRLDAILKATSRKQKAVPEVRSVEAEAEKKELVSKPVEVSSHANPVRHEPVSKTVGRKRKAAVEPEEMICIVVDGREQTVSPETNGDPAEDSAANPVRKKARKNHAGTTKAAESQGSVEADAEKKEPVVKAAEVISETNHVRHKPVPKTGGRKRKDVVEPEGDIANDEREQTVSRDTNGDPSEASVADPVRKKPRKNHAGVSNASESQSQPVVKSAVQSAENVSELIRQPVLDVTRQKAAPVDKQALGANRIPEAEAERPGTPAAEPGKPTRFRHAITPQRELEMIKAHGTRNVQVAPIHLPPISGPEDANGPVASQPEAPFELNYVIPEQLRGPEQLKKPDQPIMPVALAPGVTYLKLLKSPAEEAGYLQLVPGCKKGPAKNSKNTRLYFYVSRGVAKFYINEENRDEFIPIGERGCLKITPGNWYDIEAVKSSADPDERLELFFMRSRCDPDKEQNKKEQDKKSG